MFIGHIKNLESEMVKFPEAINKALKFIKENDIVHMEPGKYEIDGEKIFALVQTYKSKPKSECRPETHAKFLDVQYIAKGKEYMGYNAFGPELEVVEDCLADRDVAFYKNVPYETKVVLSEGMYAVLYPNDVHAPGCMIEKAEDVIKVVVKISLDTIK